MLRCNEKVISMTYSIYFRKKVLDIKEREKREKISFEPVSKRFRIGKNTVFV
ncbi:hypothetical protein [Orientia tsutsugamushi]|uniref:hypothetical protein n=1 Tax=Orientia tsutsugamushi TaxID=784 RepID=UPI000B2080FF|nr:hypothetical protein [Orientia tsutsugamushi]